MPDGAGTTPGIERTARSVDSAQEALLLRRLVWTTLFRLAVVSVLLGVVTLIFDRARGWLVGMEELYGIVLSTYAVSIVYALVLRARRWLKALAFVQIGLDVALAASIVLATGRTESLFIFMFSLAPVNGSILLYRRGAVAATALALTVYMMIALGSGGGHPALVTIFVQGAAFVITAVLAAYLAEQLRSTGEQLAEREVDLAAITALHESIVQSVSSGLITLDGTDRVTFINRAGEQITGLTLAEVRGQPAIRWFSAFQEVTRRDETDFVNARGERLRLGYTLFPLRAQEGRALGRAVIFQDLTRLRAMEEAVQRSERLADLGRLAAGLAHELRNPLASMSGSIELLRGGPSLSREDARLMDIVLREAERLNDLVDQFLDFSRPRAPALERVDLSSILVETLEVFANDPAASRIVLETALAPAEAWCDPGQIRQVAWNLLLNAAEAAGGRETPGAVRVSAGGLEDGGAWFRIEDDGPGIPPGDLERIFTPFFTTRERGTGLGLANVQRLVDAHRGTVMVRSEQGRGTEFTVRLPAVGDTLRATTSLPVSDERG